MAEHDQEQREPDAAGEQRPDGSKKEIERDDLDRVTGGKNQQVNPPPLTPPPGGGG